ncbi:MAG: DegT/DnrJ/EryC1/StrS family aminotransferase [bacterium]
MKQLKSKTHLENILAKMHKRKYCIVTSRATTALYLAMKTIDVSHKKVIIPSAVCMSPVNAILYAQGQPLFCDVSLRDFNIELKALDKLLQSNINIRALVLPHLYGRSTNISKILTLLKKHSVLLIEDVAQALGGIYNKEPYGSFGDISILSFGHTKIIDVGSGGAILFDKDSYYPKLQSLINGLSGKSKSFNELQNSYSKIYYGLQVLTGDNRGFKRLYYAFPHIYKDLYLYKCDTPLVYENIINKLKHLSSIVAQRNESASWYHEFLQHERIAAPKPNPDNACWRYSFLLHSNYKRAIVENIRKRNIHISNWYPPVHLFYELNPPRLPNSEFLGSHICNLWVDGTYSKNDIKKICNYIKKEIDKNNE